MKNYYNLGQIAWAEMSPHDVHPRRCWHLLGSPHREGIDSPNADVAQGRLGVAPKSSWVRAILEGRAFQRTFHCTGNCWSFSLVTRSVPFLFVLDQIAHSGKTPLAVAKEDRGDNLLRSQQCIEFFQTMYSLVPEPELYSFVVFAGRSYTEVSKEGSVSISTMNSRRKIRAFTVDLGLSQWTSMTTQAKWRAAVATNDDDDTKLMARLQKHVIYIS
jgi:hypothetical protein